MDAVSFKQGLQEEWQALKDADSLDNNTLYFCVDTHNIYKGALLFGTSNLSYMTQDPEDTRILEFYGGSATEVIPKEDDD